MIKIKKYTFQFFKFSASSANQGQVMLLAVLIIGASILTMTSISGYLMLQRIRSSSNIIDSTKAIFAADTGIEWELFKKNKCAEGSTNPLCSEKPFLTNNSSFNTFLSEQSIKSIGTSIKSNRALKVIIK